jgi:hypothetical protein
MDIGLCGSPPPSQASSDAANIIIQGNFRILGAVSLKMLGQLNWIHRSSLNVRHDTSGFALSRPDSMPSGQDGRGPAIQQHRSVPCNQFDLLDLTPNGSKV